MRFFEVIVSGAALIATAFAVEFNEVPNSIEPGKTYTITYSPKDNTATTIKLRQGDPNNLSTLQTITSMCHFFRESRRPDVSVNITC